MENSARALLLLLLVVAGQALEKQIKLEDIEKDNLKSDQQTKFEKDYQTSYQQAYQQQFQQYLGAPGLSYQQPGAGFGQAYQQAGAGLGQAYQQAGLGHAYQQQQYSPYTLPGYNQQQYLPQSLYQGNYGPVAGNGLPPGMAAAFQSANVNPYQAYFGQHLSSAGPTVNPQQQAIVMAYTAPALAALQQQAAAYYGGQLQQYIPGGSSPSAHVPSSSGVPQAYYQPQQQADISGPPSGSASPSSSIYSQHSFIPPFQSISSPSSSRPSAADFSQYSSPSADSSNPAFSQSAEPLTLISKPQSSQPQYLQASVSTASPLQSKYLNSPHYLSQNYNTISNSVFPKSAYSGLKSTASPVKIASSGGFLPSNPSTSSSTNYHQYRSISG